MSSLTADRKTPLDYGVQIRFIKDLHETGGAFQGGRSKAGGSSSATSKYGVAVRVQGVSGQPYVVLKEGERADSYGLQLKAPPPSSGGGAEKGPPNPYASKGEAQLLRRGRSQDSLLEDGAGEALGVLLTRPPGDGRSGSSGNLTGGVNVEAELKGTGGQDSERKGSHALLADSFPEPPPPVDFLEDSASAVDTNSISSIDRLISKFDGTGRSSTTRGRTGEQGCLESRKSPSSFSSSELDASLSCSGSLLAPNPYSFLPSSSASSTSSLGRSSGSITKATASSRPVSWSMNKHGSKQMQPAPSEMQVTPDLLRDQGQSAETNSEEDQRKQAVYSILKEGTTESNSLRRKVGRLFDETQVRRRRKDSADQSLRAELEDCLEENMQLQEQLDKKKAELQEAQAELTQLRMDREEAEARSRVLEDQRAELQEALRQVSEGTTQADTLKTDVLLLQTELAEMTALRQRQEETLRQRERELTALKGVLKDEVATHDQEMEALREQYSQDMEKLRRSVEDVTESQLSIEAEREKVNATVLSLQQELEAHVEETNHWRAQLDASRDELLSTKQELMKAQLEKDEFEEELKVLQDKLVVVKKQIPELSVQASQTDLQASLKQAHLELEQKQAELLSVKKANQKMEAEEAEMKAEMDRLRDQLQRDKKELAKALERIKQLPEQQDLGGGRFEAERLRDALAASERELQTYREQLAAAQKELLAQKEAQKGLEETNARLRERLGRLETQLQSSVSLSSEAEQILEEQNRSLRAQLEEARRGAARLGQEREELGRRLEERDREREVLRRGKGDLEEQKRLLDRALEKLTKEMEQLSVDSRQGVQGLQAQLEELRERSRRDQLEAQRQAKERQAELQRGQTSLRSLQEEVSRLKKELLMCSEERDSALLDKQLLSNRLKHLEEELDAERASMSERAREIRGLEDKVKTLELQLDEEKSSVELLSERVARSREQVEQLRSELMQERSSKQDLELDKGALERQLKDLKGQVEELRDQPRPSSGVSQMESRIQELEDRLHSEEREKSSMQSAQRRLERRLKELNITLDEERHRHAEQREQMALRMKALKRQVDDSEGEVERLEGLRRKAMRDTEEHLEQKEALQARVATLEVELRRKAQQLRRPTLDSTLSSEDDDEAAFFSKHSLPSLTEPHLQTSSC